MTFRRIFHIFAKVASPILRIIGVKKGTAADKVAEAAAVVDSALEPEAETGKRKQP